MDANSKKIEIKRKERSPARQRIFASFGKMDLDKFNYECGGQISIFDILNPTESRFCNDERINKLVDLITLEMDKVLPYFPPIKSNKKEYEIWSHVPNLGYRLWYGYNFDCEYKCETYKYCGIGVDRIAELIPIKKLTDIALKDGLELTIMQSPTALSFTTIDLKYKSKSKKCEAEVEE